MTRWEAWKDRNAEWWLPCVAIPVVVLVCLGLAAFWLPAAIEGSIRHWLKNAL